MPSIINQLLSSMNNGQMNSNSSIYYNPVGANISSAYSTSVSNNRMSADKVTSAFLAEGGYHEVSGFGNRKY